MEPHGQQLVFVQISQQELEFVLDLRDVLGLEVEESLQIALDRQQERQTRHAQNHSDVLDGHARAHEVHQAKDSDAHLAFLEAPGHAFLAQYNDQRQLSRAQPGQLASRVVAKLLLRDAARLHGPQGAFDDLYHVEGRLGGHVLAHQRVHTRTQLGAELGLLVPERGITAGGRQ